MKRAREEEGEEEEDGRRSFIVECDDGMVGTTVGEVECMDWFAGMMRSGMREAREMVVRLEGHRRVAMMKLLELKKEEKKEEEEEEKEGMRRRRGRKMTWEEAALVLPLAQYLAEKGIVEEVKAMVEGNVEVKDDNFGPLFALAVEMDMEQLKRKCRLFWLLNGKGMRDLGKCGEGKVYILPDMLVNAEGKVNGALAVECSYSCRKCPVCLSTWWRNTPRTTCNSCNIAPPDIKRSAVGSDSLLVSLARVDVSLLDEIWPPFSTLPRTGAIWTTLLSAPTDLWTLNDRQLVEVFSLPIADLEKCLASSSLSQEMLLSFLSREPVKGDVATAMLSVCLKFRCFEVAKKLVEEHGASIDKAYSSTGLNPLHWAAQMNQPRYIAYLLSRGANLDCLTANASKLTALHVATEVNQLASVETLVEAKANLNVQGKNGDTPLHIAVRSGINDIALVLIKAGASLDVQNGAGGSALHLAASDGNAEIVQALLVAGADASLWDNAKRTACTIAQEKWTQQQHERQKYQKVLNLLLEQPCQVQ